jgi:uncharacterized membrane protein YdjX (TVP38/TMEM64 family)
MDRPRARPSDTAAAGAGAGATEPPGRARPRGPTLRLLAGAALALGLFALARRLGFLDLVGLENLVRLREWVSGLGAWAPPIFILGYVLAVVAFAPGLPLTLVGGLAFGPVWGAVYVSIASTTAACLAFLIARYAARGLVEGWIQAYPVLSRIDAAAARHGFRIVMITRLVPLFPFNLQNYAYGLTGIGFGVYALTSWLCMLPATIALTSAAGALSAGATDTSRLLVLFGLAGALLALLSLVPRWLRGRSAALRDLLGTR